jgi:hypothetical protein
MTENRHDTATISARVTTGLRQRLEAVARRDAVSSNQVIGQLLDRHLPTLASEAELIAQLRRAATSVTFQVKRAAVDGPARVQVVQVERPPEAPVRFEDLVDVQARSEHARVVVELVARSDGLRLLLAILPAHLSAAVRVDTADLNPTAVEAA